MYLSMALAERVEDRDLERAGKIDETMKRLTNDGLYVFFRAIDSGIGFKCASCTESKGQGFVILAKVVVHFAGEKCCCIAGVFGKLVAFIEGLSARVRTQSGTRRGGVPEDEHMCNVLGYLCPKLRHERIEGPEGVFLEERVWF